MVGRQRWCESVAKQPTEKCLHLWYPLPMLINLNSRILLFHSQVAPHSCALLGTQTGAAGEAGLSHACARQPQVADESPGCERTWTFSSVRRVLVGKSIGETTGKIERRIQACRSDEPRHIKSVNREICGFQHSEFLINP